MSDDNPNPSRTDEQSAREKSQRARQTGQPETSEAGRSARQAQSTPGSQRQSPGPATRRAAPAIENQKKPGDSRPVHADDEDDDSSLETAATPDRDV